MIVQMWYLLADKRDGDESWSAWMSYSIVPGSRIRSRYSGCKRRDNQHTSCVVTLDKTTESMKNGTGQGQISLLPLSHIERSRIWMCVYCFWSSITCLDFKILFIICLIQGNFWYIHVYRALYYYFASISFSEWHPAFLLYQYICFSDSDSPIDNYYIGCFTSKSFHHESIKQHSKWRTKDPSECIQFCQGHSTVYSALLVRESARLLT